jgi:hypothetical protein
MMRLVLLSLAQGADPGSSAMRAALSLLQYSEHVKRAALLVAG